MRRPVLRKILGLPGGDGLSDLLSNPNRRLRRIRFRPTRTCIACRRERHLHTRLNC